MFALLLIDQKNFHGELRVDHHQVRENRREQLMKLKRQGIGQIKQKGNSEQYWLKRTE